MTFTKASFQARYFDGIHPQAQSVTVYVEDGHLRFDSHGFNGQGMDGDGQYMEYALSTCELQAQLGKTVRRINLPDDAHLESQDPHLDGYFHSAPTHFWQTLYRAENNYLVIVMALFGIVVAGYALMTYGIPAAAKIVATNIPATHERSLGEQAMRTLDDPKLGYFEKSELSAQREQDIIHSLSALCERSKACPSYTLNFRKSPVIGPNAFALPGGYVVLTDELVALSKNNDELVAVLTHELGHVKKRHALRQALQGTLSGLIILSVTGDFSSIAAGLPTLMLNMRYTRDMETEADGYALNALNAACIPTKYFATLLMRLESTQGQGQKVPELLASHPDSQKRVQPFLKSQGNCQSL